MKESRIQSYLKYVLTVIAAAFFGLLVMLILIIPLRMVFDTPVEMSLSCVSCVLASMTLLFTATVKTGYDENSPETCMPTGHTVLQMVFAVLLYVLLTVVLRYGTIGAATNVALLAKLIGNIDYKTTIEEMAQNHGGWMLLSLIIQTIPFIPAMMAGYIYGSKKRIKERGEMYGNRL